MSQLKEPRVRLVLYEGTGSEAYSDAERSSLLGALLDRGFNVTRTTSDGAVQRADDRPIIMLGRFNGFGLPDVTRNGSNESTRVLDTSSLDDVRIVALVEQSCAELGARDRQSFARRCLRYRRDS